MELPIEFAHYVEYRPPILSLTRGQVGKHKVGKHKVRKHTAAPTRNNTALLFHTGITGPIEYALRPIGNSIGKSIGNTIGNTIGNSIGNYIKNGLFKSGILN